MDVFLGIFCKFSEQLSFFKEHLQMNVYFTAVIAFHVHSVNKVFMCTKIFTEPKETEKKLQFSTTNSSRPVK